MIGRIALAAALAAAAASGQTLDEAAAALARRVAARLSPGEAREISHRSLASLPPAEMQRARALFEKALRRRAAPNAPVVQIVLTFSENRAGPLLVAEIRRGADLVVEIAPFRPAPSAARPRLSVLKQLVWEQDEPILDLLRTDDRLYVLSPGSISAYEIQEGRWQVVSSAPLPVPPVRDPRGRLWRDGESLAIAVPGLACRAPLPALELKCDDSSAAFELAGMPVRWTPARNTLESAGWPPFFHAARAGDSVLLAGADGRTRIYDAGGKAAGVVDGWPAADLAAIESPCASGHVLASRDAASLQAFELSGRTLVEASSPEPLSGTLTALWPSPGGALAVVREQNASRHAAYHVTVACRP